MMEVGQGNLSIIMLLSFIGALQAEQNKPH
jgi:hypothetical protein